MKKRMTIMLIVCIIIFGGIIGFYFFKQSMIAKFMAKFAAPTQTVSATTVKTATWHPYLTSIGTLQAEQNIQIVPQIGGVVTKIYFQSGDEVQAGAPLIDLDDSSYQAQLKVDQAHLKLAKQTYERDKKLYEQRVISRAQLDTDLSNLHAAQGAVEGDQVMIQKMHITAPFGGKLGIREVSIGEYISPPPASGGNIVPLTSLDPMRVQFSLSQQAIQQLSVGQKVEVTVDAFPDKIFYGTINALDANVSSTSRTILVEGTIPNPDHSLVPGMFANVKIALPAIENIIVVPQTAIAYSLYGNSVYVIEETGSQKIATQTFVTLGDEQGTDVAVQTGLKAGQMVVTSGQLKLHNGSIVAINNSSETN